ncbi:transglutaminase-like cysteine peptidase [Halomonas maura]|uniref:transglutaminase-like cysteine peptidase n=1 Tax=Halomonas maura TaxID=117606 RepID=UPI0025B4F1D4|nr:transglutaminase-like cysteine peptidase [Halomonas maura]MDN3556291.1 transglutaminase-like cysteine peptidase [Halomonas maura]
MADRSTHAPASPGRRRLLAMMGGLAVGVLSLRPDRVEARLDATQLRRSMADAYGQPGLDVLDEWFALLDRLAGAGLDRQLREVNRFFNRRVRWLDDSLIWRQDDYWATPLETLGRGAGDCEDYSIAKYITLQQLGIPTDRLRMIYVRARIGRSQITQAHMVLGYYATPDAEPLILDNLVPSITPARDRTDLDPLFSFNSSGLWAGGASHSRADPIARLSRWRRVLDRMRRQGFIQGG